MNTMKAYEYRDGDIVEVSPGWRDGRLLSSFKGVVMTPRYRQSCVGSAMNDLKWVFVKQLEPTINNWPGGWYPHQCRLIVRPPEIPRLPIPENVVLGDD